MNKFKIDFDTGYATPFALFIARRGWFGVLWEKIDRFETLEKAKAFHAKIKDLPEYL